MGSIIINKETEQNCAHTPLKMAHVRISYHTLPMKPEDLKNNGLEISQGDLIETLLTYVISNQLTSSEILRRQIELKELFTNSTINENNVEKELTELTDLIAEQATTGKNEIIARLYSNKKD